MEVLGHPFLLAVDAVGNNALARACGVSPQAVSKWRQLAEQRADFKVPAERVLLIEAATGGRVSRHELRPDLYPLEKIA
jgi:DNA-binding transcriptional regulator YdaS (Cro superfamily)